MNDHWKSPMGKVDGKLLSHPSQRGSEASRPIHLGRNQLQLSKDFFVEGCLHERNGLCSGLPDGRLVCNLTLSRTSPTSSRRVTLKPR